ncbi:MAG: M13 family metallopeptidase [Bacteriovorax sp.]|nr:M13 family metallopeptidase [Bacteriovorax sp.]
MRFLSISFVIFFSSCASLTRIPSSVSESDFPKILDERALNEKMDPCENFYEFTCGKWIDSTVIPAEKSSVSRQVSPLSDLTDINLNKIILSYVNNDNPSPTINAEKISKLYNSCINKNQNSSDALVLLNEQLKQIKSIKSAKDLAGISAQLSLAGVTPFFAFGSMTSFQNSQKVIAGIFQGGYALGEKDYYFDTDKKSLEIVKKYKDHIASVFSLLGYSTGQSKIMANNVYAFEKALASKAYSIADQSDSSKINHPIGIMGLRKLAPRFDWSTYLKVLGNPSVDEMNVGQPEFFQNLNSLLSKTGQKTITDYLTWLAADHAFPFLGGEYEKSSFAFWARYLGGAKEMMPQWKKCTQSVGNLLGYALAEAYVRTFDGQAIKAKTEELISGIKDSFYENLKTLDWLDSSTLVLAEEKIQAMGQKVGAPEKWRDYSHLEINETNYFLNGIKISEFESLRDLAKIGKPVDKSEWGMMPWEVNAYYEPSLNEFNFPFGILQPPSLDLSASFGANMGAFGGSTIGHELTHGFDSDGRQFDAQGNLKNWWTKKTQDQFNQKAQCFINRADTYRIESVGLNVDGAQTLTENLADQGGVKLGYLALMRSLEKRAEAPLWLNRFNERQQFWIAYAQSWCTKETIESLRQQMTTDSHPPAEFRVNEVMMNRPEFARDFQCAENSKMAPVNRCSLW